MTRHLLGLCVLMAAHPAAADGVDLLAHDGPIAVIRVVGPASAGATTAEVLAPVDAVLPAKLILHQTGPVRHDLVTGQVILAALRRRGDQWHYLPRGPSPWRVKSSTARGLAHFVKRWRAQATQPIGLRFDGWLRALAHPSPLARQLAFGALMAHREALLPLFDPQRVARVGALLIQPGVDPAEYDLTMRLLARYANDDVVRWLDTHWSMLRTDRQRLSAAGVFKRRHSPVARAALARCATEGVGGPANRCRRALLQQKSSGR